MVKLRERLGLGEDFRAVCSEELEVVIDFESLVQNTSQNIATTGAPSDPGGAR